MHYGLFLVFFCILTAVCRTTALPPSNITSSWTIDLSLKPEHRFQALAKAYTNQIQAIANMVNTIVPQYVIDILDGIVPVIDDLFGEYGAEVKGISDATGISLTEILLLNLVYDLTATCTSIVAVNSQGLVMHGRNQDYPQFFSTVLVQVNYIRNGSLLFKATTFAGFVGVPTGMNSQFSISLNQRTTNGSLWENAFEALFRGAINPTYLARELLTSNLPFDQVRTALSSTYIIAPIYYTIAGTKPGEGTVLSRNRESTDNYWDVSNSQSNWFVSQTNFDHWKTCPTTECRFQTAQASMNKIGWANMDLDGLNAVLLTPPVLNNLTLYTALMIPSQGFYITYTRNFQTNNPYCPN